jgi:hypothetical protein
VTTAPPPSQSHFAKFEHFTPDDAASFNDEFARLASSQEWVAGSQEYTRQRTIALREELELHYFSQSQQQPQQLDAIDEEDEAGQKEEQLSDEDIRLQGYQALCSEVGITIDPSDSMSVAECKRHLKNTLVNIVDLIDARRTGKPVKVWDNFEQFRAYTLLDENRIDINEAKQPPGYFASLLQRLSGPKSRSRKGKAKRGGRGSKVASGRVTKT